MAANPAWTGPQKNLSENEKKFTERGDNHTFQSKWSRDEVKYQVNVDSQHSQNVSHARAEAKKAAFEAQLRREIDAGPKFAQAGKGDPRETVSPTPTSTPKKDGFTLSDAGQAVLGGLGAAVPAAEFLEAAKAGPDIGKIAIVTRFEQACNNCVLESAKNGFKDPCKVCDDYSRIKDALSTNPNEKH